MNILIAPDSFKESMSAAMVANCIKKGFSQIYPDANYQLLPIADGGEGTVDVLLESLNGTIHFAVVTGPYQQPVRASYAVLEGANQEKIALIEIASASGLDLCEADKRNPYFATSYGTGELIKDALENGISQLIIGLGGSASNDAGAGILQALGARLLDSKGNDIPAGGVHLADVSKIDLSNIDTRCKDLPVTLACDVSNPLIGDNGASIIFGPQKGANAEQVARLEQALTRFSNIMHELTGTNHAYVAGFGAAGGAPLGLSALFPVTLKSGVEFVLDILNADALLEGVDLVITGEGRIDNQTLNGKTPLGIARRAQQKKIPTIVISGSLGVETDKLYGDFEAVFGSVRAPLSLDQVLEEAPTNLVNTARNIAAMLKLTL